MDDKTSYPSRDQLAYRLLELTAICGELPANLLDRLHESPSYLEAVIRGLKKDKLLRVYYRDKVRSYRLSLKAKDFLLLDNNERFSFYLTGNSDTNILKSELTRRLRLHRLAHAYVLMLNSGVRVFRDQKPNLFSPNGFTGGYFHTPTFYSSREVKETGLETVKIRGSRMVGTLLSPSGIFVTYSGAQNLADWDYRAELRVKSIHVNMLCNIGGYKTVHFEKGILPAVQENSDLIVERLKEYMMDQIDLSEFDGEITDEALITAVFANGDEEYTHFILSYGQVGTQYVIWLDTATLDQATVDSIMWGAHLVKNE